MAEGGVWSFCRPIPEGPELFWETEAWIHDRLLAGQPTIAERRAASSQPVS